MRIGKFVDATTVKFLLVGVINTLVGTAVMFGFYNLLHAGYWVSSAANYIVGSIVSYVLNKYLTFQNKEKSVKQMLFFVVNISVCYLLAYGLAKPVTLHLLSFSTQQIQENVAMLVGMCLFVALNYFGQRFIVFKSKQ
ncbi:GtrA family protein [Pseudoflavonifractor capillosus]|uniref:GtrA family protein n=1 Tax=Pseudoflavonifractor capillosus TaxID=106588 RepID=UPI00195A232E|nr:GtrA family protein [Pseudoflavonifractor capillosus]MBM6897367.1 GtrA family protein [Pseudoflavonifractor capillosus]